MQNALAPLIGAKWASNAIRLRLTASLTRWRRLQSAPYWYGPSPLGQVSPPKSSKRYHFCYLSLRQKAPEALCWVLSVVRRSSSSLWLLLFECSSFSTFSHRVSLWLCLSDHQNKIIGESDFYHLGAWLTMCYSRNSCNAIPWLHQCEPNGYDKMTPPQMAWNGKTL